MITEDTVNETTETPATDAPAKPAKAKPAKKVAKKPAKWLTPSGKAPTGVYSKESQTPRGRKLPPGYGAPWVDALYAGKRVVFLGGTVEWDQASAESGKEAYSILRKAKSMPYTEAKAACSINRLGKMTRLGIIEPR